MENNRLNIIAESVREGSKAFNMERVDKISDVLSRLYIRMDPNTRSVDVVIQMAVFFARRTASPELQLIHFLMGLLCVEKSIAVQMLEAEGVSIKDFKRDLCQMTGYREGAELSNGPDLKTSNEITWLIKVAHDHRLQMGQPWVNTGHLLLCLVQHSNMSKFPPLWMALRPVQLLSVKDLKDFEED